MSGALDGLKVVEIGTMIAGPLCAQILGDHGAEVIKIESPMGDPSRDAPPMVAGNGAYYAALNRNKSTIALDLTKKPAQDVLLRLLEDADVLVENLLPGALARWGLGYDAVLAPRFPRLIYCGISGFGNDGPLGGRPGYDAVVQAYCGLMSVNGTPESGMTRMGIAMVDVTTGMNAAMGVLLAVNERNRSGRGQAVDVTLFDSALGLQIPFASKYFGSGETEKLQGNGHPTLVPYDKFVVADGDLYIGVANVAQFRRLVAALGHPEIADDPRFNTNELRTANREALHAAINPLLATWKAEAISETLMKANVPASPVHTVPQAFEAPHTKHRHMRVALEDGYQAIGVPIKLGRTPGSARTVPHSYGADTDRVLAALGFSAEEIDALAKAGALPRTRAA